MLLNYLYPEMEQDWIVDNKGTFYRNYNQDILDLYVDEKRVELSRDGFLKLLPQGLLSSDDDLQNTNHGNLSPSQAAAKTKEIERRIHLLSEAFLPLDALHFRRTLRIERHVSDLLHTRLEYLLKEHFGFDLAAEQNPYIQRMAPIIPYAKQWRGDFAMLRKAMESLFHCPVATTIGRYSYSDSTLGWLPFIRFDLLIPNLTPEEYKNKDRQLQPLATFLREWFIPAEMVCQVKVQGSRFQVSGEKRILDYNTEINN